MKLNRMGWLSLVLAFMLLFTSVQAGASVARVSVPRGYTHGSADSVRSVTSLPGVKTVIKGNSVTYRIPGPLHLSGKRLVMGKATSKGAPSSISMNSMDSLMGLDDTYSDWSDIQPFLLDVKPSSATFSLTMTISDTSVVDLVTDTEGYYYLEAQDTGKATVSVKTSNGKKATKVFTVKDQVLFTSMSVSEVTNPDPDNYKQATVKSKTMYAGDATWVMAQPRPYTATYYDYPYYDWYTYRTSAVNFTSSNESVATVDPEGDLYARAPGKATITATARDGSKKKYSFQLTVKAKAPEGFDIYSLTSQTLAPGTTCQLYTGFNPDDYYDQKVTWTSSDTSVAKVDASGLVTAVSPYSNKYPGSNTATITATTNTGKMVSTAVFTITYNKVETGATYRFYGIGNNNYVDNNPTDDYDPALKSCINDMHIMAAAAADAGYSDVNPYEDQESGDIMSVLLSMATNSAIDNDDVTVFFYSGHGAGSDNQLLRGALCGTDGNIVTVDSVQSYLDQVPGTVVVILDSCLSGQYITAKSLSPASRLAATKSFGSAWITKLSGSKATNFTSKALTSSAVKSKYKILVAAESLESSYGDSSPMGFGWFTFWASTGLGRTPDTTNGSSSAGGLLADVNIDNVVSLQELYSYVTTNIMAEWNPIYQQHTQVWPANDNFALVNKTT